MLRTFQLAFVSFIASAKGASLSELCTTANVQAALPVNGILNGINTTSSGVTASIVYNATLGGKMSSSTAAGGSTYNYCNVTVTYTHSGVDDEVVLGLVLPDPSEFANRYYVGGGGGYSLSSDATGGLPYGAVGAVTSAGYDAFSNNADEVILCGNGSINWNVAHMFGYKALGEMTKLAKPLTRAFYSMSNGTKLYTYYEGCSDGGREGTFMV
jgi:tannase